MPNPPAGSLPLRLLYYRPPLHTSARTRWSLPCVTAPVTLLRAVTPTMQIECERDELALHLVADTDRRAPPRFSAPSTASTVAAFTTVSPGTHTGSPGS
eukprot:1627528-Pleurochrysis_carterae.AAC.1